MVDVSIIIVSYNVESFVSLCLGSIYQSESDLSFEVIVVDSFSSDDSVGFISNHFPEVYLIQSDSNIGFAKACNMGVKAAQGAYFLFLNPDTILGEDTIQLLYDAYDHDTGAIGPLMIDGAGRVLPESARELPTTMAGIAKLFRLPIQEQYPYYKKMDGADVIEAPVLTGACMFVDRHKYTLTGGFDERYFMYGEDIDLSLQFLKLGYINRCLLGATIVHFKGESTDKKIAANNNNFYEAMQIFIEKNNPKAFSVFSKKAVSVGGASLSLVRTVRYRYGQIFHMIRDLLVLVCVFFVIQFLWSFFKVGHWCYYGVGKYFFYYLVYAILWVISMFLGGIYFKGYEDRSLVFKTALLSGLALMVGYSLLPIDLRFSRMIMSLAVLCSPFLLTILRRSKVTSPCYFVTDHEDSVSIFSNSLRVSSRDLEQKVGGDYSKIIFSFFDLLPSFMISFMKSNPGLDYFFFDGSRQLLFSSLDKGAMGGSQVDQLSLFAPPKQLQKRVLDIGCAMVLLPLILIVSWFHLRLYPKGLFYLFKGQKTMVGYCSGAIASTRPFYVSVHEDVVDDKDKEDKIYRYASQYSILDDLYAVVTNMRLLIKRLVRD